MDRRTEIEIERRQREIDEWSVSADKWEIESHRSAARSGHAFAADYYDGATSVAMERARRCQAKVRELNRAPFPYENT